MFSMGVGFGQRSGNVVPASPSSRRPALWSTRIKARSIVVAFRMTKAVTVWMKTKNGSCRYYVK